jgi:hypothetical protein
LRIRSAIGKVKYGFIVFKLLFGVPRLRVTVVVTAKVKDSAARTLNGQGVATVIRHDGSIIPHGKEKSSLTLGKSRKSQIA